MVLGTAGHQIVVMAVVAVVTVAVVTVAVATVAVTTMADAGVNILLRLR